MGGGVYYRGIGYLDQMEFKKYFIIKRKGEIRIVYKNGF